MTKLKITLIASALILALSVSIGYRLTMPGARFLVQYMKQSEKSTLLPHVKKVISREGMRIPIKIFTPAGRSSKTVLLVHGVHYMGYEELRLLHFAEVMVGLGYTVVVPDIQDLKNYVLTSKALDEIEQSALWILDESKLVNNGEKIGLFGISFSGGLGLSVASRASLNGRISTIFAFGGHGDLDKTLDYLLTGVMPDGSKLSVHIYGIAVVARWFAEKTVPQDQVKLLRGVLLDYLSDREIGKRFDSLPQETKTIVNFCRTRDDTGLELLLRERLGAYSTDAALSPVRGPVPQCRIFLLHGSADNVIPRSEAVRLAEWAGKETRVTMLVSRLIQHVELGENGQALSWNDYWEMIRFTTELFRS
jgi:acetyl esterase/lipase